MRLEYADLQSAFDDLKKLTGDNKQTVYAMLDFSDSDMQVCYSDPNITYNRKLYGESEEGDTTFKAIVDIKLMGSRLELFKPSGNIYIAPISITISGDSLELSSNKYLMVANYDDNGELIVGEDGQYQVSNQKGMEVNTKVRFYDVSSNVRFSATTRAPYELLYLPEEGNDFVTVQKSEFIGTFERLIKTLDSPVCAISPQMGMAFAPGKSYVTKDGFTNVDVPAISLSATLTGRMVEIFKKDSGDAVKVLLTNDKRFTKVVNEDDSLAVMLVNTNPKQSELATLMSYEQTPCNKARLQFNREMFVNLVKMVLSVMENGTAASKVQFQYDEAEDKMTMLVNRRGSGSAEDAMTIIAENYSGGPKEIEGITLSVVFKVLDQAISPFATPVIEMRIGETPNTKIMRIAEIERNQVTQEMTEEYMVVYMCA